jgi:hypothetical protein
MDCAAMDWYGRGDAAPAVTVSPASPGTWIDAIVRFCFYEGIIPALAAPCAYIVDVRRTSPANLNRPYYVLKWPDLVIHGGEREGGHMAGREKPPATETRGGDRIDWAATEPGEPLRHHPALDDEIPDEPPPRDEG